MKVKSDEKHKEDQEKLLCIEVDGKIDKDTLMYREVKDENGETKLKKGKGEEHHLLFYQGTRNRKWNIFNSKCHPRWRCNCCCPLWWSSQCPGRVCVHTLKDVLIDNTNTNTGCEGSLVKILENETQRKLHTIGCSPLVVHSIRMSFLLELFSNTLMAVPKVQLLSLVHWENSVKLPTMTCPQVEFTRLSGPLDHMKFDETTLDDLSSKQRLILEYVLGISKGKVNRRFAALTIGPLNHAIWLTLAIRLMCLWTKGAYPPELQDKLRHAVKYVVQVYAVSWFEI